jgi:DNA polymerase-2
LNGWILDLYPALGEGLIVWVIADSGERLRLRHRFPITFYAAGPDGELRRLWQWLSAQPEAPRLSRVTGRDIFHPGPLTLLAAEVEDPAAQPGLFLRAQQFFAHLSYYDADLPLPLRFAAASGVFPLARVSLTFDERRCITRLDVLDSPWDLDPEPPPLRVLRLAPDCDPRHATPRFVEAQWGRRRCRFSLEPARPLLINLCALLQRFDPDLLLTAWGDTWLLPHLLEQSAALGLPLPLNRDETMEPLHRPERSYQAYGRVVHRGRQVHLFGRWHIDADNAMMYHDYDLEGVFESARVTATPVQQAARLSPGSGISAMQVMTALRSGILTPWHKQQAEMPKSSLELTAADQGGLVYQPIPGVHHNVAAIDFVSMYPSIMAEFNVSPETMRPAPSPDLPAARQVPELGLWIDPTTPGLIPETLRPLLAKRIALKQRIANYPKWDPRRKLDKARAQAHKWLLVTCFGYLGYKNARFGRIEAHQAVTAYSRECLLRAKEAAEDLGYTVLHLYVDGLWVQHPAGSTKESVQPLLDEITRRTRLPIALDGIYRWVVFCRSKTDQRLSVANRYFGAFEDGSLKIRGIEARREDTPPFIARVQTEMLEILAQARTPAELPERVAQALAHARQARRRLRQSRLPVEDLIVTQRISRALDEYRTPSPAAQAAAQLEAQGKPVRPGMRVRFVHLRDGSVCAWDCPPPPPAASLDLDLYTRLLGRACASVLEPFLSPSPEPACFPTLYSPESTGQPYVFAAFPISV